MWKRVETREALDLLSKDENQHLRVADEVALGGVTFVRPELVSETRCLITIEMHEPSSGHQMRLVYAQPDAAQGMAMLEAIKMLLAGRVVH